MSTGAFEQSDQSSLLYIPSKRKALPRAKQACMRCRKQKLRVGKLNGADSTVE